MKRFTIPLATFVLLLPAAVFGAEQTLTLEPESTQVDFFLTATGHDVEGHLYLQSGEIVFDPETGAASGEIRIDAVRTETGNPKRDKTMHRKVLESLDFPSIVFTPQRLEGSVAESGASELELVGSVSIIGSEHPLTLPTKVSIDGDRVTAEATFKVPFVEWGLHDPSMFILKVGKEVEVTLHAAGAITPATMAAGAATATLSTAGAAPQAPRAPGGR